MSAPVKTTAKRVGSFLGHLAVYLLIWLALTLFIVGIGIHMFWGSITVDQMMMNLVSMQTDGGGGDLVWLGILAFGVLPVVLTLGVAYWQRRRRRRHRVHEEAGRPVGRGWLTRTVSIVLVAAVVVSGTAMFGTSVHVGAYIKAANSDYTIDQYYRQPEITSAEDARNVVMIYLESGEETLSDTTLFEKDPFIPLKDVTPEADGWDSVDDFQQYEGGGWTMSGITGTQCGVPLKGNGLVTGKSGLNSLGGDVASYLGGLTCVGDIFKEQGYHNVFMGGANGSFAAKDKFLSSHGYDEQYDLADWRAKGEPADQFRDDWGLSDKRLMANAKEEVDSLHAEYSDSGTPFNLSMLTVDTHEPVHIYDYCDVDTESEVTSMFACSMTQVADFVHYMEEQGYLEDTAVVIMGDHLKHMGSSNAFGEELGDHPNRTIFNRVWVPGDDKKTSSLRGGVDQLSMMPTILEAAGIEVEDRQAGLGVSAFATRATDNSAQSLDQDIYRQLLESRSQDFYSAAWEGEEL
ncbi:LTA synthase family protein [Corynebacterium sp. USCH3]|uniref:LTA synthase family protein n=1 Tax=Corynebacterium sp. USCH3 TaxID=3024840 RepID=UPI0030B07640